MWWHTCELACQKGDVFPINIEDICYILYLVINFIGQTTYWKPTVCKSAKKFLMLHKTPVFIRVLFKPDNLPGIKSDESSLFQPGSYNSSGIWHRITWKSFPKVVARNSRVQMLKNIPNKVEISYIIKGIEYFVSL